MEVYLDAFGTATFSLVLKHQEKTYIIYTGMTVEFATSTWAYIRGQGIDNFIHSCIVIGSPGRLIPDGYKGPHKIHPENFYAFREAAKS